MNSSSCPLDSGYGSSRMRVTTCFAGALQFLRPTLRLGQASQATIESQDRPWHSGKGTLPADIMLSSLRRNRRSLIACLCPGLRLSSVTLIGRSRNDVSLPVRGASSPPSYPGRGYPDEARRPHVSKALCCRACGAQELDQYFRRPKRRFSLPRALATKEEPLPSTATIAANDESPLAAILARTVYQSRTVVARVQS